MSIPQSRHASSNHRDASGARRALWLGLLLFVPGGAQNKPPGIHSGIPQPANQSQGGLEDSGSADNTEQEKRLVALNAERQRSMVSDTNKLLKLVNELNAELSAANPDALTPQQLHKLDQIEKLAHNVKQKMSTSVRPAFVGTPIPMQ